MNITCSKCYQRFSITADQLGTRGKCPHCRATIILPKSARTSSLRDANQLAPPSRWPQSLLSGFVAAVLHAGLLGIMLMVPWGTVNDGHAGNETIVMIGQLPRSSLIDRPRENLDENELIRPDPNQFRDSDDTALFSPNTSGPQTQPSWEHLAVSPSLGGKPLFDFESLNESTVLAGGDQEFEQIVSRLNQDGLDIVITFDSTGSMQGEIDQVKSQIQRMGSALFALIQKTRIGVCTYRDHGDSYVVQGLPLTDNLAEIVLYLEEVNAGGGGDEPEAVEEGLRWASEQSFRRSARKVILLFGDAPPRNSKSLECQQLATEFRRAGGIVSTVTCRNKRRLDDFVKIAHSGGGEAFLTANEQEIMTQLMILVFGSQHREKVIQAFDLLDAQ